VFTIDDGFIDHHDIAAPLFSEFDIPLTFFLVTDFIDGKLWPWDDQVSYAIEHARHGEYEISLQGRTVKLKLASAADKHRAINDLRQQLKQHDNSQLYTLIDTLYTVLQVEQPASTPRQYLPMSWQQANTLAENGHCVAAHTRSHRILSRLTDEAAEQEITQSIQRVNAMISRPSAVFAYPTGRLSDFTAREHGVLERNNIVTTVSTECAPYIYNKHVSDDIQRLPRLAMPTSHTDFIQYLGWIEFLKHKLRQH
jgi:peptidoglycan/xylan/chitin deacetylase (PgdA/CDA1 family)